ncbi:DUF742 domain-containing protein [Amycolatopsis sp. AA4]|uniref:DUF742 domain-containing protein n=1 Tax=Actinomycetes TaxID=1760 RepID=UPI0001B55BD0|nr:MULTISPECIES: DUF742 domain-containing protein [Actinomycetes]ATY15083.1 DUF742 domain-containing protein [Amycolatopsis sp. AA4]EFL11288.1 hypothetical protein SSMG_06959 [Streptomyces sp. AA4]
MKISGFGDQDTGAWDALHKGTERESFDSPSRYELSSLTLRLPHRQPRATPPPPSSRHAQRPEPAPRPVPAPAPAPRPVQQAVVPRPVAPPPVPAPAPAPAPAESWDDGYEWVEDGESGYWEEPQASHRWEEPPPPARPAAHDPYSFDEYAGSPGPDDRVVPEGSAYQREHVEQAARSRHALPEEPPADSYADPGPASGVSELDRFWANEEPAQPEPPAQPTKSRVRPYARTRGRTHSDHNLALEALVSTSDEGRRYRGVRSIEHRRICDLCLDTRSVAEIAAHLRLPLGVVKVLVGDMADIGLVMLHQTDLVLGDRSSREFMERVLQGLRNL